MTTLNCMKLLILDILWKKKWKLHKNKPNWYEEPCKAAHSKSEPQRGSYHPHFRKRRTGVNLGLTLPSQAGLKAFRSLSNLGYFGELIKCNAGSWPPPVTLTPPSLHPTRGSQAFKGRTILQENAIGTSQWHIWILGKSCLQMSPHSLWSGFQPLLHLCLQPFLSETSSKG